MPRRTAISSARTDICTCMHTWALVRVDVVGLDSAVTCRGVAVDMRFKTVVDFCLASVVYPAPSAMAHSLAPRALQPVHVSHTECARRALVES